MLMRALIVIVGVNAALFGCISNLKAQDNNPFSGAMSINVTMHKTETCIASWYGSESGNRTANGERFRPDGISCAHKTRPFGSRLTVTMLSTGRAVSCRVNDRGPFVRGRCIDLSRGAARALGMNGTARVTVE